MASADSGAGAQASAGTGMGTGTGPGIIGWNKREGSLDLGAAVFRSMTSNSAPLDVWRSVRRMRARHGTHADPLSSRGQLMFEMVRAKYSSVLQWQGFAR